MITLGREMSIWGSGYKNMNIQDSKIKLLSYWTQSKWSEKMNRYGFYCDLFTLSCEIFSSKSTRAWYSLCFYLVSLILLLFGKTTFSYSNWAFWYTFVQATLSAVCPELLPLGPCLLLTIWMTERHHPLQTMVRYVCNCGCVLFLSLYALCVPFCSGG